MQGFRLSHAGLVLEHGGASLFIDPGNFSTHAELSQALEAAAPPAGIVITHEHADHWTPEHVRAILALSPEAKIYTTAATAAALETAGIESTVVVTEGDIDAARLLGKDPSVRPGFSDVRLHIELAGPETQERYEQLRDAVDVNCPVLDLFANATPVSVTVAKA